MNRLSKTFIKEKTKLLCELSYQAGLFVGIMKGTLGIYHIPTDEEIEAIELWQKRLEEFIKKINKTDKIVKNYKNTK